MSISEANAGAKIFHNASTLKAEDRRERLTFLGLSMPAVLAILIVVFLPIFWLSSLSFYNAAGELSTENYAVFLKVLCIVEPLLSPFRSALP